MTALRTAAQQALEALKMIDDAMPFPVAKLAMKNLRSALAEPVQEPVGEVEQIDIDDDGQASAWFRLNDNVKLGDRLYTAPPQRKPLSEEEIAQCFADAGAVVKGQLWVKVARAVERAHGIT